MDTLKGKTLLLVVLVVCAFLSEDVQGKEIDYRDLPGIPCDRDGGHEGNCRPSDPVNTYTRGCSPITDEVKRNINGIKRDEDGSRNTSCLCGSEVEVESFCLRYTSMRHCLARLGDVISMEEGSLGARNIKDARTLVNLGISRDLPPPITEGPGMGGPGHSLV
ncbi:Rapid ALkalinization Factor [Forsythia ovata]|uniref:Rapid ALkalinization Factor n=1 Tax=Forsythia ovata TaxID=205694 RepID=A0ABD1WER9_9LAMI